MLIKNSKRWIRAEESMIGDDLTNPVNRKDGTAHWNGKQGKLYRKIIKYKIKQE
jgi:hypothetical protein